MKGNQSFKKYLKRKPLTSCLATVVFKYESQISKAVGLFSYLRMSVCLVRSILARFMTTN